MKKFIIAAAIAASMGAGLGLAPTAIAAPGTGSYVSGWNNPPGKVHPASGKPAHAVTPGRLSKRDAAVFRGPAATSARSLTIVNTHRPGFNGPKRTNNKFANQKPPRTVVINHR